MVASFTAPETSQAVASATQEGWWFLDRMASHAPVFNVCRAYRITGELNLGALRSAWQTVTEEHEILRTRFAEAGGRPVPKVAAEADGSPGLIDLSDLPPAVAAEQADRLTAELTAAPFDLATGPLARLTLLRLNAAEHRLLLVLHRAAADEDSMEILLEHLSRHYLPPGNSDGTPGPGRPPQYSDFARQERTQHGTLGFRQSLDWWRRAMTPPPPALTLPFAGSSSCPWFQGGGLRFDWGLDTTAAVLDLARRTDTTPFDVLLTAFQALLHRYGGPDRVAVGVPASVRTPAFEDAIGPFGNLLMLCGDLSGAPTFRELLGRISGTAHQAFRHRTVPFGHLVRVLNPHRDPHQIPWCDAMFVFPGTRRHELSLAGAVAERLLLDPRPTTADLTLTVEQVEPTLQGTLTYRGDLAEPQAAAGVLGQLHTLLVAAAANPDTPVGALPMDGPAERAALLDPMADAARLGEVGAPAAPVHELIRRQAARTPEAIAVAWDGGTMTYRRLIDEADLISGHLHALGGVDGKAVVVRMASGARQAAASLGVLQAGGHLVWFGPGDTGARGRMVLDQLRPGCLIVDGEPDGDELARWYRDRLGGAILDVAHLEYVQYPLPDIEAGPGRTAYVAYTSGSSGRPKGIVQSHGAFAQFVTWMADAFGIGPGSRVALWVAPEHDPSLCEVFATLTSGGTLHPIPARIRLLPEKLVDWLAAERITFLETVPSFARELLKAITATGPGRLAALDHLALMGEALPGELVNGFRSALPTVGLTNAYGPTETIAATWYDINGPVEGTVPIGRPIPGRQVLVLDEQDRPCPTGVTGQIVICSRYVAPGYVGGGDGTAFRPVEWLGDVPCYRTGDLGRLRWDGLLEFRGRRDLQVKVEGTRMELADVEAALTGQSSVEECAVVPLTDRDGLVTHLVAYIVPGHTPEGFPAGEPALWRAHLRSQFGTSMRQVLFHTMSQRLPRNIGGKVDRSRLPDPRDLLVLAAGGPRSWAERAMAEIWSGLGVETSNADETFFAAGGHSLLIPPLADRVRERFGVTLPLREFVAHASLADLSALVTARSPDTPPFAALNRATTKVAAKL